MNKENKEFKKLYGYELICNVFGSSQDDQEKSWIGFWRRKTGTRKNTKLKCSVYGCGYTSNPGLNKWIYGGHVYLRVPGENHGRICYIMPLCPKCNNDRLMDYSERGENIWVHVKSGTRAVLKPMYGPRPTDKWW